MTSYAHSFSPGGEPKKEPKFKAGDHVRYKKSHETKYVIKGPFPKVMNYSEEQGWEYTSGGWDRESTIELDPDYALPTTPKKSKALETQVGGTHYSDMVIQPAAYNLANNIGWAEGDAISYISRWRNKGGLQDLRKARQTLLLLIEHEEALGTK